MCAAKGACWFGTPPVAVLQVRLAGAEGGAAPDSGGGEAEGEAEARPGQPPREDPRGPDHAARPAGSDCTEFR